MKIEAKGEVTPGPGTTRIVITIPKGWTPRDENASTPDNPGDEIDIDSFAEYLRYLTEGWMVEVIRTPDDNS